MPDITDRDDSPTDGSFPEDRRPRILWKGRTLRAVNAASLEALKRANSPPILFQSGRNVIRLRRDDFDVFVEPLNEHSMRHHLDQAATFVTAHEDKDGNLRYVPCPPHRDFVLDLLAMPKWPSEVFPPLKGIIRCPVFAADATLITTPGYNSTTRLWYQPDPNHVIGPIPEKPSTEDKTWAKTFLMDDFLADFPFADAPDKANALAYLLTFFVREMISSPIPLALIEAPAAGTGKSLLAKCLAFPALGRIPPANPPQTDDDQWRKLITSLLISLPMVIWVDNISGTLRSPALEAVLTGDIWQERELRTNNLLTTRIYAVFIATANNLQIAGDLPRRIVWIGLDAKIEHPEERDTSAFRHPELQKWMQEQRSELVRAALILVQAWIAEGKPMGKPLMGSFESWTEVLGGILQVAGVEGFLDDRKQKRRGADDEALQWYDFCEAWWKRFGNNVVAVKDLFDLVASEDYLPWVMTASNEAGCRQRLGRALQKARNRCFGSYRIVEVGHDNSKRKQYQLEVVANSEKSVPSPGTEQQSVRASTTRQSKLLDQPGDYVDDPDESDSNPTDGTYEEDPLVLLCDAWWFHFNDAEIVDVVLTREMARFGIISGEVASEVQKRLCAETLRGLDGRKVKGFRIERTDEFLSSDGNHYSCYRLRLVEGTSHPADPSSGIVNRAAATGPYIFTGDDWDIIMSTTSPGSSPSANRAPNSLQ